MIFHNIFDSRTDSRRTFCHITVYFSKSLYKAPSCISPPCATSKSTATYSPFRRLPAINTHHCHINESYFMVVQLMHSPIYCSAIYVRA